MLDIIKQRTPVEVEEYRLEFTDAEGAGYSFPCDAGGEVKELSPEAAKNYQEALAHPEKFEVFNELVDRSYTYVEPAIGKCHCGCELRLDSDYLGAVQCECGQWYNLFGQELKDPEYWEEEY